MDIGKSAGAPIQRDFAGQQWTFNLLSMRQLAEFYNAIEAPPQDKAFYGPAEWVRAAANPLYAAKVLSLASPDKQHTEQFFENVGSMNTRSALAADIMEASMLHGEEPQGGDEKKGAETSAESTETGT